MAAAVVDQFVEQIPPTEAIRSRLAANQHERELLRKLLSLAERRDQVARERQNAEVGR